MRPCAEESILAAPIRFLDPGRGGVQETGEIKNPPPAPAAARTERGICRSAGRSLLGGFRWLPPNAGSGGRLAAAVMAPLNLAGCRGARRCLLDSRPRREELESPQPRQAARGSEDADPAVAEHEEHHHLQ